MKKQLWAGVVALLAAGMIVVGPAAGAGNNGNVIQNGGFETGKIKPWKKDGGQNGFWFVYSGFPGFFPPPAEGDFAIGGGQEYITAMTLTQKFRLPQNKPANLFFWLAYVEFEGCGLCDAPLPKSAWQAPAPKCAPDAKISCGEGGFFCTPDSIRVDGPFCNQQLRVDILKANADPGSFDPKDVLQTLFVTEDGDPFFMDWTPFSFDVSQFAGRQIQLRILIAANLGPLFAAVDGVGIYKSSF